MSIVYTLMYVCCVHCNCVIVFLGYVCEQHNNPADFFLDVISENESSVTEGTPNMLLTVLEDEIFQGFQGHSQNLQRSILYNQLVSLFTTCLSSKIYLGICSF